MYEWFLIYALRVGGLLRVSVVDGPEAYEKAVETGLVQTGVRSDSITPVYEKFVFVALTKAVANYDAVLGGAREPVER